MLPISISGQHFDVTPTLNEYVMKKLERLERHTHEVTNVHVVLTVEKLRQIAKATVAVSGNTLNVSAEDKNMYAAIDKMIDELDRQAIKHKEKRWAKRSEGNGHWPQSDIDETE